MFSIVKVGVLLSNYTMYIVPVSLQYKLTKQGNRS